MTLEENGQHGEIPVGLSFDDVLLRPRKSDVLPAEADLSTRLVDGVPLNIPVLSAAMDTVTEDRLAVALAREGGFGVIHRNCGVARQCEMVERVKRSENTVIDEPITVGPDSSIHRAQKLMQEKEISGIPVVDDERRLMGMITRRDMRFVDQNGQRVTHVMTPRENLVTASPGTGLSEAQSILHEHKIEKLPLVNEDDQLEGMMTGKDIEKRMKYRNAVLDDRGRLRVGAAIGVGSNAVQRASSLVEAGTDALVIDAATGHTTRVLEMTRELKERFPDCPLVAGNAATREGAADLVEAGADAVKAGVGPGSICTTRVVSGVGVPQFTAIRSVARACREHDVPVIADGGIRYSGDILKALAAGADTVMTGSLLAGTEESPGRTVNWQGRTFKEYRGMGSQRAMEEGSSDRYARSDSEAVTPEGVESRVPYKGDLSVVVQHLMGGLRSGMGYVGASDLERLRERARFLRITPGGLRESHAHDVELTEEPINYSQPN